MKSVLHSLLRGMHEKIQQQLGSDEIVTRRNRPSYGYKSLSRILRYISKKLLSFFRWCFRTKRKKSWEMSLKNPTSTYDVSLSWHATTRIGATQHAIGLAKEILGGEMPTAASLDSAIDGRSDLNHPSTWYSPSIDPHNTQRPCLTSSRKADGVNTSTYGVPI